MRIYALDFLVITLHVISSLIVGSGRFFNGSTFRKRKKKPRNLCFAIRENGWQKLHGFDSSKCLAH
jgi:hypothetical protein